MKLVFERGIDVPAGQTYNFSDHLGGRFTVSGPGDVYVRAREYGERRMALTQRRARGFGDPAKAGVAMGIFPRHRGFPPGIVYGRRDGDKEAHQERRHNPPLGPAVLGSVRRRKGDERRVNHYTYKSSNDPRIVALERRKA